MLMGWMKKGWRSEGWWKLMKQLSRPGESSRLITDEEIFVPVVMNQSEESRLGKGSRSETT